MLGQGAQPAGGWQVCDQRGLTRGLFLCGSLWSAIGRQTRMSTQDMCKVGNARVIKGIYLWLCRAATMHQLASLYGLLRIKRGTRLTSAQLWSAEQGSESTACLRKNINSTEQSIPQLLPCDSCMSSNFLMYKHRPHYCTLPSSDSPSFAAVQTCNVVKTF